MTIFYITIYSIDHNLINFEKINKATKTLSLVKHGSYNGFIDFALTATCTDCKIEKNNKHFIFYKNRVNPTTHLCLYVNKKCDDCRKLYMVHKKMSETQIKDLNIERPIPSTENPYPCDCCNKQIITTKINEIAFLQ